jgi:hypothetical protein
MRRVGKFRKLAVSQLVVRKQAQEAGHIEQQRVGIMMEEMLSRSQMLVDPACLI